MKRTQHSAVRMSQRRLGRSFGAFLALILLSGGLVAFQAAPPAEALSGNDFQPGYIISDSQFYDANAMTEAQIQTFLNTKIGSCSNTLCLNVVKTTTFNRAADRNICTAYSGASNETTARIIFKVQRACGISAKVILATLQKEQSLVTGSIARAPTSSRLARAMGYGCPDSAGGACDANFYGLYNQIYKAAWQFKRYSTPDLWGNYHPGIETIKYHPNSSCGSKSVNIKNHATAALYNYTPYTPNAAALANLRSSAPPCGSYGNRNFWVFYNDWFGSPTAVDGAFAINEAYALSGGSSGPLGAKGTIVACPVSAKVCHQTFAHGVIYWAASSGARTVSGAMGDLYLANDAVGGTWGFPTSDAIAIESASNGNGVHQKFSSGGVGYTSSAGTYFVSKPTTALHTTLGWVRTGAGWPTSAMTCTPADSGCEQQFQNGTVYQPKRLPAQILIGSIAEMYAAAGGPDGDLKNPISGMKPVIEPKHGNGTHVIFESGVIHESAAGTFLVSGKMMPGFSRLGWVRGAFGWPIAEEICHAESGNCSQKFQKGIIYLKANGSSRGILNGSIANMYESLGGQESALGSPTSDVKPVIEPKHGNGTHVIFESGVIHESAAGTFLVSGKMMPAYSQVGWVRGAYGWPIAAEVCDAAGKCSQAFQGCTLVSQ